MKKIYATFSLLVYAITAIAQNTNKVWIMGYHAGIDFNTSPPSAIHTGINMLEGCASISDSNGQLLMYTAGDTVFNRSHQPMPDGYGLVRAQQSFQGTCTQASLIVPVPGSHTIYCIFSLEADELGTGSSKGRLFYSMVDMSLNNGLGNVIAGQKSVILDSFLHEKMTAVAGCNNNIWVMVRPRHLDEFWAYEITSAGINTQIVKSPTSSTDLNNYQAGTIKFSPDGTKMVSVNNNYTDISKCGVQIFNFNRTTGKLYAPVSLSVYPEIIYPYGACFSPDNTKLYVTESSDIIWQYDLSLNSTAAIISSRTNISNAANRNQGFWAWLGDMQTGPDGKIYIATSGTFIDMIEHPNIAGTGCNHTQSVIGMNSMDWIVSIGLPNAVVNAEMSNNLSPEVLLSDTVICAGSERITVSASVKHAAADAAYEWGPAEAIRSAGKEIAIVNPTVSTKAYLTVTNSGQDGICNLGPASDTIHISTRDCGCQLYLPNAFSPNGDGLNDFFTVQAITPGCFENLEYSFIIFNRWGEKVYDESAKGMGWNGTYKKQPAAPDVYYYRLAYKLPGEQESVVKKGDVTLIR